jgi:hypothetical protein
MAGAQSILGSIVIGKDTSGNFKHSLLWGLASRLKPDGPFYARLDDGVGPIPDEALLPGTESLIYRLPVAAKPTKSEKGVRKGDIIILSDDHFCVVFVDSVHADGTISGYLGNPPVLQSKITPPSNLINHKFWVVAAGPDRLFNGKESSDLLPLLLAMNQGSSGGSSPSNDFLTTILTIQSLGKKQLSEGGLELLLLLQNNGTGSSNLLPLYLALRGGDLVKSETK